MHLTKEEKKAREIATKLVNVLAEIQLFFGDVDLIYEDAKGLHPTRYKVSERQLKEIREEVSKMAGEETILG